MSIDDETSANDATAEDTFKRIEELPAERGQGPEAARRDDPGGGAEEQVRVDPRAVKLRSVRPRAGERHRDSFGEPRDLTVRRAARQIRRDDDLRDGRQPMSSDLPKLYLARHGDTAWTDTDRHTGRTDCR